MRRILLLGMAGLLWTIIPLTPANAQIRGRLCGTVLNEWGQALNGASIQVSGPKALFKAISDSSGFFCIDSIPTGRWKVDIQLPGYLVWSEPEIEISTGITPSISCVLYERVHQVKEIVVKGKTQKGQASNTMVLTGARRLQMEEASRYAGGFDDPARLAASFGGVSGGIGNNGMAVRGNKPGSFQWRVEGIEIPNPNHFADILSFGAGGLSALSASAIAGADFYTGAFPAEFGNTLAGIMDLKIRNGNAQQRKYAFRIGAIGTELFSEGPWIKNKKSTYLMHYRYSTLSLISPLLPPEAGGIRFQDFSGKWHFPTRIGKFSFWCLGARDRSGQSEEKDSLKWKYDYLRERADSRQGFIASGLHYKISLSKQSSVSSTLSWNTNDIQHVSQRLNNSMQLLDHQQIKSLQGRITSYTVLEKKWHPTFVQRSGIYFHRVYANHVLRTFESNSWQTIANSNKTAQHLQVYTQSKWSISNQVQVLAGVYSSYLSLSKQMTLEPRISGSWLLHDKHTLSAAYGNHSQMERLALYSIQNPNGQLVNSKLKLSRAHHYLIAYEWIPSEKIRMKAEPYWQHLYQLPVVDSSSFSAVNMTGDWFFQQKLINTGQGENIGLDVTVERFLDKGFYYLLTGSVFRSRYQGGDGIWRDTRFNRQWILNALGGWEWKMGKSKSHLGSINLRLTMQGGERITPAHWENNQLVNDESKAFQQSLPAQTLLHTTLQYRINRKKHASLWSLQVINALATPDIQGYVYNRFTHQLDYNQNVLFIPNLSYKIEW